MKIYLHFYNNRNFTEVSVEKEVTIGNLIKQYASQDANAPDYQEDLEVFLEDGDQELSKDASLKSLNITDGTHFHFSRCKKIATTVMFNGANFQHNFSPAKTVGFVLKKALLHFKIEKEDGSKLSLFLSSTVDEPIPTHEHIGSLTGYPTCRIMFYLSKKKTFQG